MRKWAHITRTAFVAALCGLFAAADGWAQDTPLAAPDPDEIVEDFRVVDQDLQGVLEILSQMTGRSILRPQALPTPKITFDSGGPISVRELILALESLLSLNGIGVSPLGDRFLKVVPISDIRTQAPELVTSDLADRDASGKVVSKLFRLQHLDSQTFQQQIQPFLSPGFSTIIPFQNSNAVIVTDTISNLQRLEYVVGEVDKPSRLNIEPVFITLQFAEATQVAQQIQQMIEDARSRFGNPNAPGQGGARGNQGGARENAGGSDAPPPPAGSEGGGISQVLFGSNTAISSDERTNQIIIMTAPSNLQFFENIIERLDIKADPSTRIDVIPLKHADATEVASLLSQFVSGRSREEGSDRNIGADRASAREANRRGAGSPTFGGNQPQQQNAPRDAATAVGSALASVEERDSQFSSFMTILADERSNALVLSGTRNDLELMAALVDKIDLLLPQVRIEVIIAEVNLNENEGISRGMDAFSFTYAEDTANDTAEISVPALGGDNPGLNFLGLGLGGTFDYSDGVISNLTLNSIFNTARSNSNVSLLSVPTLVTTHNKEASIVVAEARPIVTSSQTSAISDSFRQSVQYEDIGIELTVTPLIGPNDVIQLEIDQKIDDISGSVTIGGDEQPIIGRRQATSYVSVADGELVVLGGLQRSRERDNVSKTAFFGEIPLLGKLFQRRGKENLKSELLVFLRPQVIRTTGDVNSDARKKIRELEGRRAIERFLESGEVNVNPEPDAGPAEEREAKPRGFRK